MFKILQQTIRQVNTHSQLTLTTAFLNLHTHTKDSFFHSLSLFHTLTRTRTHTHTQWEGMNDRCNDKVRVCVRARVCECVCVRVRAWVSECRWAKGKRRFLFQYFCFHKSVKKFLIFLSSDWHRYQLQILSFPFFADQRSNCCCKHLHNFLYIQIFKCFSIAFFAEDKKRKSSTTCTKIIFNRLTDYNIFLERRTTPKNIKTFFFWKKEILEGEEHPTTY